MILIIPDVHGREFWKAPCQHPEDYEKIIFLGDYLDPYPGEATAEEALENFKEILKFKKDNPDKVILLIGNHDCPYAFEVYRKALDYWCRHDNINHYEICDLFEENEDLFQFAWECDNKKYGKILFTHAGVTNQFKKICGLSADEINKFYAEETNGVSNKQSLAIVSWYRGGDSLTGSLVWADVREHMKSQVPQMFQIFGHTYCKREVIMEHFAMLDIGKTCWVLDDDEIREYGNSISRDS